MFATVHNTHLPQFMSPVSEAQDDPGRRGDSHSPLVAVTTVVSTLTTSVCGPPSILSVPRRPAVTTGICLERQVVPSARMEALVQHYQAAGFSREVSRFAAAPRRLSTNRIIFGFGGQDNGWVILKEVENLPKK